MRVNYLPKAMKSVLGVWSQAQITLGDIWYSHVVNTTLKLTGEPISLIGNTIFTRFPKIEQVPDMSVPPYDEL